jgi:antitoxin component YwqK of YwqJK toxin-antitoxin module
MTMQKIFLLIALFYLSNTFAQEINSFDENGKRHGAWMKYYDNTKNLRYKGQFDHGKEVGVFEFFHQEPKGKHPSCVKEFTLDSDIALVKYYTSTGVFLSEGKMKGQKRTGVWLSYERATGVLVDKETYKDGLLNGVKTSYYADGKVLQTQEFKNNLAHGKKIMYAPNGNISSQYIFNTGKTDGLFAEYDKSEKKSFTGKYKMNKPQGIWKYYEDGKLVRTKDYTRSNNPLKKNK